ncbi:GIY-YIG nuclease family protein, partial [Streptomyces scabiei]
MTSVIPEASTATPDTQDQRATEPTALYRLHNTGGTLLYIGVTDNPDRRFQQHRDTKPWWPQVAEKAIEWHPSRDRALAEEATAIKAETPVYNIDRNPAAPSYHWPPTGMPTDRVDTIERVASTLPASEAEGIRRAAFEEFTRAQLDERATAGTPSTPTGQQADDTRLTPQAAAVYLARLLHDQALATSNPAA